MKKLCLMLAFILLFTSGCMFRNERATGNFKVYFALKGNVGLGTEERAVQYNSQEQKYINTLKELISGPKDTSKFETGINAGTKVIGVQSDKDNLTVNLSKEFAAFSGELNEAAAVASVVDTMLQFTEIKKVRITVEGKDLVAPSGKPYGYMEYIDFKAPDNRVSREVTLYFADSQGMYVVPEKRTIQLDKNATDADLYRAVVEELIKGPTDANLYKTIPPEVKINDLVVDGDTVNIDFSEEMYTKHWRGAAGETMTIASLVNTLTEFDKVKKVMPSVDGGPLSIDVMVVESPLTRMDDIIYKP